MITFVTGNDEKWHSACAILQPLGVDLVRATFELPEIQSMDVAEIAAEAAVLACRKVNGPVMVTDAGYYFEALGGFPGPFVKYTNRMLTAEDMVQLMQGKVDRRITVREALAYMAPEMAAPQVFTSEMRLWAADHVGQGVTVMDKITILDGFDAVVGASDRADVYAFWRTHLTHYQLLAEWLAR